VKSSIVRAAAVAGVAAILIGLGASPASAVTPPTPGALSPGSSLFVVRCDGAPLGQLYSVNVSNAAGTPIGSGSNINNSGCAGGGAWDYATKPMYYLAFASGTPGGTLVSINLSTGVSTAVGALLSGATAVNVNAIAIGLDGSASAIDNTGELYTLNLASGALTPVASNGIRQLYGFAADPVTGAFYVLNSSTGVYSTINLTTAALTAVGTLALTPQNVPEALQIDVNGTFWVENDGTDADIWSFDPANPAGAVESGVFTVAGTQTYMESLLLNPGVAPTITSSAPAASVPVSTAYSYQVTASGTAPITFSVSAGALPTGLTLDPATGVISGTPTTVGSYSYTVTATNARGTASVSITQAVAATTHLPIVSG
jgi:hypothetical protein